jgi:hypothetical protein
LPAAPLEEPPAPGFDVPPFENVPALALPPLLNVPPVPGFPALPLEPAFALPAAPLALPPALLPLVLRPPFALPPFALPPLALPPLALPPAFGALGPRGSVSSEAHAMSAAQTTGHTFVHVMGITGCTVSVDAPGRDFFAGVF